MIKIDLLPTRLQRKKRARCTQRILLASAVAVLTLLIMIHILLGLLTLVRRVQISNLEKNYRIVSPFQKEADSIKGENNKYKSKVETITQLVDSRLLWARKLNQLSNAVVPGVWLTELSLHRPRFLKIKGAVTSKKEEEMSLVGKFMDSLKESPFFNDFRSIELEAVQSRNIKDIEVMDFVITCFFNEGVF